MPFFLTTDGHFELLRLNNDTLTSLSAKTRMIASDVGASNTSMHGNLRDASKVQCFLKSESVSLYIIFTTDSALIETIFSPEPEQARALFFNFGGQGGGKRDHTVTITRESINNVACHGAAAVLRGHRAPLRATEKLCHHCPATGAALLNLQ